MRYFRFCIAYERYVNPNSYVIVVLTVAFEIICTMTLVSVERLFKFNYDYNDITIPCERVRSYKNKFSHYVEFVTTYGWEIRSFRSSLTCVHFFCFCFICFFAHLSFPWLRFHLVEFFFFAGD